MKMSNFRVLVDGIPDENVVLDCLDTERFADPVEFTIRGRYWPVRIKEKPVTPLQARCQEMLDLVPVFEAGVSGKPIQQRRGGEWRDVSENSQLQFGQKYYYRIKPEPKYRPYTACEALELVGKRFKLKSSSECGIHWTIDSVTPDGVIDRDSSGHSRFQFLLDYCAFEDGSPCGVLIED